MGVHAPGVSLDGKSSSRITSPDSSCFLHDIERHSVTACSVVRDLPVRQAIFQLALSIRSWIWKNNAIAYGKLLSQGLVPIALCILSAAPHNCADCTLAETGSG